MSKLTTVSETLFVPLMGRIYTSENNADVLYDETALSIKDKLPDNIRAMVGQNEYTLLASATRSKSMDYYINEFLSEHPEGIIINAGCGLETMFYRNDNGRALWFELDLPDVIQMRNVYIPAHDRDICLAYSIFDYNWIKRVKSVMGDSSKPVLVIASGLFHYFTETQVKDFIRALMSFSDARILFDAVSPCGLKITKRYMKKMDREEARMFFCVGSVKDFAKKVSPCIKAFQTKDFYSHLKKSGKIKKATKLKMFFSDMFGMVRIIGLKLDC